MLLKDMQISTKEGDVLDENGKVVGKHKGFAHYTIGKEEDLQFMDT